MLSVCILVYFIYSGISPVSFLSLALSWPRLRHIFESIISLMFWSLLLVSCIELSLTGSVVAMVIDSVKTCHFFSSECNAKTSSTLIVGQTHETRLSYVSVTQASAPTATWAA